MHGGKAGIAAERMLILQLRAANVNRISRISVCFRCSGACESGGERDAERLQSALLRI